MIKLKEKIVIQKPCTPCINRYG